MKTTSLSLLCLAALATIGASAPALAQEATPDDWTILPQPQTVVQQKAAQAEAQASAFPKGHVGKSRVDVRAELASARRDGSFDRINDEAWRFDALTLPQDTRLASRTR